MQRLIEQQPKVLSTARLDSKEKERQKILEMRTVIKKAPPFLSYNQFTPNGESGGYFNTAQSQNKNDQGIPAISYASARQ